MVANIPQRGLWNPSWEGMYADAASHRLSIGIVQTPLKPASVGTTVLLFVAKGCCARTAETAVAQQENHSQHMNWLLADGCPDRGDQQLIATGSDRRQRAGWLSSGRSY